MAVGEPPSAIVTATVAPGAQPGGRTWPEKRTRRVHPLNEYDSCRYDGIRLEECERTSLCRCRYLVIVGTGEKLCANVRIDVCAGAAGDK